MNHGRRSHLLLAAIAVLALGGCSSSPRVLGERSSSSKAPVNVPGTVGYLYTSSSGINFFQWQTDASGAIQGTQMSASIYGDAPSEQVSTNRSDISGQVNDSSVTLDIGFHTDQGVLSAGTLSLNVVQQDGSIQPIVYRRASDADYNAALAKLNSAVQQTNNQQSQADNRAAAEQQVAKDYQAIGSDETNVKSDLSSLKDTVSSTATDVGTVHSDERNVLSESGNGTDNGTVCGDAASVSGDAASVSGDASSLSGDLSSFTSDLTSLDSDARSLSTDLAALLKIEPGYTGGGNEPSPSTAREAVSGASSAASADVQSANGDIDKENSYVSTAYGYAADAEKAGNCGELPSPPSPISHVSASGSQQS